MMEKKARPKFHDYDSFRRHWVEWSDDTIRRRIEAGFPAIQQENGRYLLGPDDAIDQWFKRRTVKAG